MTATKMDIGGAYLNASMTGETVIMELNPQLSKFARNLIPDLSTYVEDGKLLVKLGRALYECAQSAKLWHDELTKVLEGLISACIFQY
jgi:hypothetical protein